MMEENHSSSSSSTSSSSKDSRLLDWTAKQGRILTSNGNALKYYTADRGFPYSDEELPHYYLMNESNNNKLPNTDTFEQWSLGLEVSGSHYSICGAWSRKLFVGGWEYSDENEEIVYNIQTNTLFIDIRIPNYARRHKDLKIDKSKYYYSKEEALQVISFFKMQDYENIMNPFKDFNGRQLAFLARRHAFAGFTKTDDSHSQQNDKRLLCTRHHCMDWNFVGNPRPRPNKWYVEMNSDHTKWKEWSFATDDFGQHYYSELWERLDRDGGGKELVLALRKIKDNQDDRDGIIVIVGDHFNYIFDRRLTGTESTYDKGNLVDLIDASIDSNDFKTAESYLSLHAGHGTISSGWMIDCATFFWNEGMQLISPNTNISIISTNPANESDDPHTWRIIIDDTSWKVYESSCKDMDELRKIFLPKNNKKQKVDHENK